MKYQVIYFSRKKNTKKIAEAISEELKVKTENVKNAKLDKDSFVFLGTGNYGGKPGKKMTDFIKNNNFKNRKVALFGTSGGGEGNEVLEMEKQLKEKNAKIIGKYFCKGQFFLFSRGKPDKKDITDAKEFAKDMKNK